MRLGFLSLERQSLRYKLLVAFTLMSIIPLLVLVYFATYYIFPEHQEVVQVSAIILITLWISLLGYFLIKQIINPVIDLALETKIIAEGKYTKGALFGKNDELGDIQGAVSTMTERIRSYIGELQEYSKKTASLNIQIHRKVITLTNLMRIGDLIMAGAGFNELARLTAEKLETELDSSFCAVFVKERIGNYASKCFINDSRKEVPIGEIEMFLPFMEKRFKKEEYILLDSRAATKPWQKEIKEKFNLTNVIFFALRSGGRVIGIIMLGNFADDLIIEDELIGVVRAFAKELILGYQSGEAYDQVKSLEIVDTLTGLYTRPYLEDRIEDEINRAVYYQRPCSVLIIDVDRYDDYLLRYGEAKAKLALRQVAKLLSGAAYPIAKIARFDRNEFCMLVPEKNKRESLEMAEDIRAKVESMKISEDPNEKVTVSIGVGENPIDGTNSKEVLTKAYKNVEQAKLRGQNQVVGE